MPGRFPIFEMVLKKRGRKWRWCVCTTEGKAVMLGSEGSRAAARYEANSALFLLLLTSPYRSRALARSASHAKRLMLVGGAAKAVSASPKRLPG